MNDLGPGSAIGASPETDTQRVTHVEEMLTHIQTILATQFVRIADMQVLIDRLTSERNRYRPSPPL